MRISRFDSSLTEESIIYGRLINIWAGNKIIGEIEMQTSCIATAKERYIEQALEVWQNTAFEALPPAMHLMSKPEKEVYKYLKDNVVDCYSPVSLDIRDLACRSGINRNSVQRALKEIAEQGTILFHQKRGKKKGLYVKM